MKKGLLAFFILTLCLILVGCNSSSDKVITVWTYPHYAANEDIGQESYEQHLQDLIADFTTENPDWKVEYEILSWAEGGQKFDVAINSGNPPDIFFSVMEPKFIHTGLAVPLNDYISQEELEDLEQFAINNFSIGDDLWAISQWISIHTWGGNRAMLEAAGADVAKIQTEGWTWQEFYDIAAKATQTVDGKKVYGFATQGLDEETLTHLMRNNGVLKSIDENGNFHWGGEKAIETLDFIQKLMDDGIMPKETAGIDAQKVIDMFTNEEVAIYGRTGPYQVRFNDNRNKEIEAGILDANPIDFVLLPFPHNEGEVEVATGGGGGMWLFKQKNYKGDEHTAKAAELLLHLTGTKSSITAATMFIPPARKSGQEMYADLLQLETDNGQFIQRTLEYVVPGAKLDPELAQKQVQILNDGIRPRFQGFLSGDLDSKRAVEEWTRVAESVLGK